MQLLTRAWNWRIASAAAASESAIARFTLPAVPAALFWRIDVKPTGTVDNAEMDLRIQGVAAGSTAQLMAGPLLVGVPVRQLWPNIAPVGGDEASAALASHGPWDLILGFDPGGDVLSGPVAGRLQLAYWQ